MSNKIAKKEEDMNIFVEYVSVFMFTKLTIRQPFMLPFDFITKNF